MGISYVKDMHHNLIPSETLLLLSLKNNVFHRYVATSQACYEEYEEAKVTLRMSLTNIAKLFKFDLRIGFL